MVGLRWILCLFVLPICFVNAEIGWNIATDPIIINQDLKLVCKSTSFCDNCTSRWSTNTKVLSFFDAVTDRNKHAISIDKEGVTLTIKKLNHDDVNKIYRCSIGFQSFSKNLTLPKTFEHHPTRNTSRGLHSLQGKDLQLTYHFEEVHPEPNCSVHLDEENLSPKLKIYKTERGQCLEVTVKLTHTLKKDQDGGRLRLKCSTGTRGEIYYEKSIGVDSKSDWNSYSNSVYGVIGGFSVLMFMVAVVVLQIHRKRHADTLRLASNNPDKDNIKKKHLPLIFIELDATHPIKEHNSFVTAPGKNDGSSAPLLDVKNTLQDEREGGNVESLSARHLIQRTNSDSNSSTESRFNELARDRFSNMDELAFYEQTIETDYHPPYRNEDNLTIQMKRENTEVS